ncbi:MAG: ComEC family competence protein [Phaeodactylibacter sp.]|nr:ComEC family competence protein [Phaeodactylibacter sp.]
MGLSFVLLGLVGLGWSIRQRWAYQLRWINGALFTVFFLGLGFSLSLLHDSRNFSTHFQNHLSDKESSVLIGRVVDALPAGQRLKVTFQVNGLVDSTGESQPVSGRLLAYLHRPSPEDTPIPGDQLIIKGKVQSVLPPLNPDQFDYQQYLKRRGIYHQIFADSSWRLIGHQPSLLSNASNLRARALKVLQTALPTPNEYAVGAALTMGYKSALTEEIEHAYANTGAMHVLAVSGLHVGLVQLILFWLLGLVPLKNKWWRALKTGLIILSIWAFALITGASPSVLRASAMFSFLAVGLSLQRSTNVYNTLAASALALLVVNPDLIYYVGFQLSYLAVLGIIYFQPRIYSLWHIENWLGDYLWKLCAVALAAQLGTLPLSLFYFHQFPLYFVLSGLIVVPAAGLILSLTLLLLALNSVPVLGVLLAKVLYVVVYLVNAGIFLIQQLPGGVVEGIWVGRYGAWALYLILFGFVLAFRIRQFKVVLVSLFIGMIISASYAWQKWQSHQQEAIVIYQVYKHTAIDAFLGTEVVQVSSKGLDQQKLKFTNEQHRWHRRAQSDTIVSPLQKVRTGSVTGDQGFWRLGETTMLILQNATQLDGVSLPKADVVVLSQSPDLQIAEILQKVSPRYIVADGSNLPWRAADWQEESRELAVDFFYTATDGAVLLEQGRIQTHLLK